MTVTVKLPTQLRPAAGGSGEVEVSTEGETVASVIEALFAEHAELRDRLTDDDGQLRRFVNVYVDGEDIRFSNGLKTAVTEGCEVQVLPAVAGG